LRMWLSAVVIGSLGLARNIGAQRRRINATLPKSAQRG
jgi:hypothetical protein